MAVSINWGLPFVGVPIMNTLLFGVYIRAPDVWKLSSCAPCIFSMRMPRWKHQLCLGCLGLGFQTNSRRPRRNGRFPLHGTAYSNMTTHHKKSPTCQRPLREVSYRRLVPSPCSSHTTSIRSRRLIGDFYMETTHLQATHRNMAILK